MTQIFDEKEGYLTPLADELIVSMRRQLDDLAEETVRLLNIREVPEVEWNLFMLYYKEHVYTTLLEYVARKRLSNQQLRQLASQNQS